MSNGQEVSTTMVNEEPPGAAADYEVIVVEAQANDLVEGNDIDANNQGEGTPNNMYPENVDLTPKRLSPNNGNLQLLIAFSIIVMADAVEQEGVDNSTGEDINRDKGAAIAFGAVSFVFCLLKYFYSVCFEKNVNVQFEIFISFVLLAIWTAGVIFLTFLEDGIFFQTSSGFFASWGSLLVAGQYFFSNIGQMRDDDDDLEHQQDEKRKTQRTVTSGLMGYLGVAVILAITVIASSLLQKTNTPNEARAVTAVVFTVIYLLALLVMLSVPIQKYSDPFNFVIVVLVVLSMTFINVLVTILGEPFAQRVPNVEGLPPVLAANGFFSVLGSFMLLCAILWKSHNMILKYNEDNEDERNKSITYSKSVKGRYIWLFLLFLSSIVVFISGTSECENFGGCDENNFFGPLLALSFFQAFLIPFVYCVTRENSDHGDEKIKDPEYKMDFTDGLSTAQRGEFLAAIVFNFAWIGSAATFTFGVTSPFNTISAPFFFIWLSAFFSTMYFSAVIPQFGLFQLTCFAWKPPNKMKPENNFGLGLVLIASIIQISAVLIALNEDVEDNGIQGEQVLTLILQGIMLILVIVFTFRTPRQLGVCALILSYQMILISYLLLFITTIFSNPFDTAQLGNGFFAAWISFYGAFLAYSQYEWELPLLDA